MHHGHIINPANIELQRTETTLRAALEAVSDGFIDLDNDWRVTVVNKAAADAFGVDTAKILGRVIWEALPGTQGSEMERKLRHVSLHQAPVHFEAEMNVNPRRTVDMRAAPKIGGGVSVAFSDVTDFRRAENARVQLQDELNHRVRNTLAVVQAVTAQSLKSESTVASAKRALDSRLAVLAATHSLLTAQNWGGALIGDLVNAAVAACANPARFQISGPAAGLRPPNAVTFALAIHELCYNAMQYGALSEANGRVRVSWHVCPNRDGEPRLRMHWSEHGGPPVRVPLRRGFGSRLLEIGLARDLRGMVRLEYVETGLQCFIDVPLPESPVL